MRGIVFTLSVCVSVCMCVCVSLCVSVCVSGQYLDILFLGLHRSKVTDGTLIFEGTVISQKLSHRHFFEAIKTGASREITPQKYINI